MGTYEEEVYEQFSVLCTQERGVAVVAAYGELDLGSVPRLRQALEEMSSNGAPQVVADLSELSFMDSSGLGLLIEQRNALQARSGKLWLVAPEGSVVLRMFKLTKLDKAFKVHADRASAAEEALESGSE